MALHPAALPVVALIVLVFTSVLWLWTRSHTKAKKQKQKSAPQPVKLQRPRLAEPTAADAVIEELQSSAAVSPCLPKPAGYEASVLGISQLVMQQHPGKQLPPVRALKDTPLHYVTTTARLRDMVKAVAQCPAIGVDVEHHAKESFRGIVCLVQVRHQL